MLLRHYVTSVNKEVVPASRLSHVRIVYSLFSQQLEKFNFTFTFSHFADAFIQSDLQLGKTKRFILKRQSDRGSVRNTKSQALFK